MARYRVLDGVEVLSAVQVFSTGWVEILSNGWIEVLSIGRKDVLSTGSIEACILGG